MERWRWRMEQMIAPLHTPKPRPRAPLTPRGPRRALVRYRKDGMRVAGVLVSSSPAFCCFAEVSRAIARAATADVTRSWPGRVVRVPPRAARAPGKRPAHSGRAAKVTLNNVTMPPNVTRDYLDAMLRRLDASGRSRAGLAIAFEAGQTPSAHRFFIPAAAAACR